MKKTPWKRYLVLGILFFLPVTFLLLLYPATHNYQPLDIVQNEVLDFSDKFQESDVQMKEHLTVLAFLGQNPLQRTTEALNTKELVYDKFLGFKKFQVIIVLPIEAQEEAEKLRKTLITYDELKYWHFLFLPETKIKEIYNSLHKNRPLDKYLSSSQLFIIDKDLNQRGRLDDRTDNEKARGDEPYALPSYNSLEVAVLKNKMSEDMRVLFTEYRQKRKGSFDAASRRNKNLNTK